MQKSLQRTLKAMPPEYREPMRAFRDHGVMPENRLLANLCCGRLDCVIDEIEPELGTVLYFLKHHCPPFSHGSIELAARWCFLKQTADGDRLQ